MLQFYTMNCFCPCNWHVVVGGFHNIIEIIETYTIHHTLLISHFITNHWSVLYMYMYFSSYIMYLTNVHSLLIYTRASMHLSVSICSIHSIWTPCDLGAVCISRSPSSFPSKCILIKIIIIIFLRINIHLSLFICNTF